jgi:hypothetical protein
MILIRVCFARQFFQCLLKDLGGLAAAARGF